MDGKIGIDGEKLWSIFYAVSEQMEIVFSKLYTNQSKQRSD